MKILAVYYMHKKGGLCKRLYALLNSLADAGHSVTLLSLGGGHPGLSTKVRQVPIRFPLQQRSGLLFWGLFTVWLPLALIIFVAAHRPDRMVLFGAYYAAASRLARRLFKIPATLFLRSLVFKIDQITEKPVWIRAVSRRFELLGLRSVSHIVCMTEAMKAELLAEMGALSATLSILPNNLPPVPSGYTRTAHEGIVAVASGVLDKRKNIKCLIAAIKQLAHQGTISLRVIGDGPERSALQAFAEGCPAIYFRGWSEQIWQELASADLFIHPSRHEGISNSVLEALASGCAVLASDIPEHRAILSDELLFSPERPEELAALLLEFVRSPDFALKIKQSSERAAEKLRFNWEERAVELATQ